MIDDHDVDLSPVPFGFVGVATPLPNAPRPSDSTFPHCLSAMAVETDCGDGDGERVIPVLSAFRLCERADWTTWIQGLPEDLVFIAFRL